MIPSPAQSDLWSVLSRFTTARIGLGRVGVSLPTWAALDFNVAHARARDVIYAPLNVDRLMHELQQRGLIARHVWSQAANRIEYLRRPDLGRRLSSDCVEALRPKAVTTRRLSLVIADGLSSRAPSQHAVPLLDALLPQLTEWILDDVVVATQARVALGDAIGELQGAEAVAILIGERPGLNAADSLGVYITYRPHIGCTDAERNCISNIRLAGLSYEQAAYKLTYLLRRARELGGTGIRLKDDSDERSERVLVAEKAKVGLGHHP